VKGKSTYQEMPHYVGRLLPELAQAGADIQAPVLRPPH